MPGYKGHCAGALILYIIVLYFMYALLQPSYLCVFELAFCTIIGALFPDIDIKSKGQKYFYWMFLIGLIILCLRQAFMIAALCSILILTPMLVRHRGIFHHPLFLIMGTFAIWIFLGLYCPSIALKIKYHLLFFLLGALSHVWLDVGSKRFVKQLAPKW